MADRLTPFIELFRELRRRKVIHVAAVYLGGAIVGLDAMNNAMDTYGLPLGIQRAFGVLVVLGFPVAVLASWWYDWTGEGIRKVDTPPPSMAVQRLAMIAAIFLVVATGTVSVVLAGRARPEPSGSRTAVLDDGSASGRATVLGVLPIEHAGQNDRDSWFATAIAGQLEAALAEIPAFTVVHRRSLEPYLGRGMPLDSLADLLEVDYFVSAQVSDAPDGGAEVIVELVDAPSGEVMPSSGTVRAGSWSAQVIDTLVVRLQEILQPALGRQIRLRQWRESTRDTVAIRLRYQAEERFTLARDLAASDAAASEREFTAADSLLAAAIACDPDWIDPRLARAELADRWAMSRLSRRGPGEARTIFDHGIEQAQAALGHDPDNARALALRGHLRWRKAVLAWDGSQEARDRLVEHAEADLRAALDRDPQQVTAAASLSEIMYRERHRFADARQYAERAYRQDAYLDHVNEIINRIAVSAFEMGDDREALEWCRRGLRRSPGNLSHRGTILEIMAWGSVDPEPEQAWGHLRAITEERPASATYYRYNVASVLARAGLSDSARAVLERHTQALAPDAREAYLWLEAAVRFRLGDIGEAERLFAHYRRIEPDEAKAHASRRLLRGLLEVADTSVSG